MDRKSTEKAQKRTENGELAIRAKLVGSNAIPQIQIQIPTAKKQARSKRMANLSSILSNAQQTSHHVAVKTDPIRISKAPQNDRENRHFQTVYYT